MPIQNQILFFLAGLGVFNGLLLTGYLLFFAKPKRWVNVLLGLLLLMLCFRIGKSIFHVFMDLDRIYLQIGLSACAMIGPLLFVYVRSFLVNSRHPRKSDWMHLLLPLFGIIGLGLIWPYERFPEVWNNYMVSGIYTLWIIYTAAGVVLVWPVLRKIMARESGLREHWLATVVICISLICLAYNLAYHSFPYLAGPLLFSLVLYVLLGFLFSYKNRMVILQQEPDKYQNQKLSSDKSNELLARLTELMDREQSYLNPKVKLAQVAQAIDSTPHELSQIINDRLGFSFNHYINEQRVHAACDLLKQADHLSIEGIGQEVGFNSRSAFYQAFKSQMNQTPAKFRAQIAHSSQ